MNNIRDPIIHCYVSCWNEARILPFWLDYYSSLATKIYLYDNYSSDGTIQLIKKYATVERIPFDTADSYDEERLVQLRNNSWKQSRGKADLVIVCDADEFIWHENLIDFISRSFQKGISLFKPEGCSMISETFPVYERGVFIMEKVKNGWKDPDFSKCILFNPQKIAEINFTAGSHFCYPWGKVKIKDDVSLKLLHYKYLGEDYLAERYQLYRQRYSCTNCQLNSGFQYLQEVEQIRAGFRVKKLRAEKIL